MLPSFLIPKVKKDKFKPIYLYLEIPEPKIPLKEKDLIIEENSIIIDLF